VQHLPHRLRVDGGDRPSRRSDRHNNPAASICVPGGAAVCKMYATIEGVLIAERTGLVMGIVFRMRLKRSLVGRLRHMFMKLGPESGGASKVPFMSAKWHDEQVDW
jgi:hypothetical protein